MLKESYGMFPCLGFLWFKDLGDSRSQCLPSTLYRFAVQLLLICWKLSISPSIENPTRSWLWGVLALLVEELGIDSFTWWFSSLRKTSFHACMHGSQRNKQTSILAPPGLFDDLEATCDGQHPHLPWEIKPAGRGLAFATADEAAYPALLCSRMAKLLQNHAESLNISLVTDISFSKQSKHALGQQTTSAKPLVPEFSHFHFSEKQCNIDGYRLLASPLPGDTTADLPKETKKMRKTFKYGVQWEPQDFLEKAKDVQHPKNPHKSLPDVLKEALFQGLSSDPIELAKHRLQVVLAVKRRASELVDEEKKLKSEMDSTLSEVLAPKSLALWKSLMKETGYQDVSILDMVWQREEHDMPPGVVPDWRPATTSGDELLATSVWRRKAIQGASPELELEHEKDLHEASLAEVAKGHLHGPLSEQQVTEALGDSCWLFSPRFAVYQGDEKKVRPIDDCKRSGLNSAYTVNFKLELFDIDALACLLAAISESTSSGHYECKLSDGSLIGCKLHHAVASDQWMGRTLDLSRAYKQLGLDLKSRRLSVVGYKHEGEWKYYLNHVLPFGATASVYSFNRVSKSLHHIICKLLFSLSTCFYDDFPTVSPKASSSILTKSLSAILNLLGWDHAQIGVKAIDFASDFAALGVSVNLKQLHKGSFVLANKPGRIDRICNMLRAVVEDGCISKNRASEIQGHLNFASGFYISKALQFLVAAFGRLADIPRTLVADDLKLLCNMAINLLTVLPPRQFKAGSMSNPLLTFTDGAWELEQSSMTRAAAVHVVSRLRCPRVWSDFGCMKLVNRSFLRLKCSLWFVWGIDMQPDSMIELVFPGLTMSRRSMHASKELHFLIQCWWCVVFFNRSKQSGQRQFGMNAIHHIRILETCHREIKSNVPLNFSQQMLRASGCLQRSLLKQSSCFTKNHTVLSTLSLKGSKPVRQTPNKDEMPQTSKRKVRCFSRCRLNFLMFCFCIIVKYISDQFRSYQYADIYAYICAYSPCA